MRWLSPFAQGGTGGEVLLPMDEAGGFGGLSFAASCLWRSRIARSLTEVLWELLDMTVGQKRD